jgi:opacity protein-like surface antigen
MSQGIDPRVRCVVALALLIGAVWAPMSALAGTTPAGEWQGTMKTPEGEELDIFLSLAKGGTAWTGTLESDAIGQTTITGLRVSDTRIGFTFQPEGAPFPAHFTGSYIAGDDRVTGTFSLRGNSRFVKFQRVPGSEAVALAPGQQPPKPKRIRHDYKLALSARYSYWAALHVVKDDVYNLNTLTTGKSNYDAALNWFIGDEFNVFFRAYRGGQGTTDNAEKLAPYANMGISTDSYLQLDGMEIGIKGYLGSAMARNSKFNPYLTATAGKSDWAYYRNERGSTVMEIDQNKLEGKSTAFAFGIGTEYELSKSFALDFEWAWRYFLTSDEGKWPDPDTTWSNTHAWTLSVGLMWGFL